MPVVAESLANQLIHDTEQTLTNRTKPQQSFRLEWYTMTILIKTLLIMTLHIALINATLKMCFYMLLKVKSLIFRIS